MSDGDLQDQAARAERERKRAEDAEESLAAPTAERDGIGAAYRAWKEPGLPAPEKAFAAGWTARGMAHPTGDEAEVMTMRSTKGDEMTDAATDERETELLREIETLRDELAAIRPTPPSLPPTPGSGAFSFGKPSPGSSDPMPPGRRAEYQRRIEQANERHRIDPSIFVVARGVPDGDDDVRTDSKGWLVVREQARGYERAKAVLDDLGVAATALEGAYHAGVSERIQWLAGCGVRDGYERETELLREIETLRRTER